MLFSLATPLHWSASARSEWLYKPSAAPKKSCHFLLKTLLALSCGLKQPQTLSLLSAPACSSGFAGTGHRWKISGCAALTLHFKILQADAGFAAQMTGENMLSQPFFCLIFSCSKTSLICSSNSSPPTACISWFSEELGKSSLSSGPRTVESSPAAAIPCPNSTSRCCQSSTSSDSPCFSRGEAKACDRPPGPKRSMRRAGVGPSLPFQHHMAGQIESAALPRAIWRRRWSGATCAWEGTIDFSMIPASSTRFWWKDGSFKCSTLKCQSLQPVPAGKHPDRTGSSRYEYLGISGWSGPRTVRCFSAHLLSFFPAALLSQTVGNIVHAAAGMLMVWSKDPRPAFQCCFGLALAEHWQGCSCCWRYPVQGYAASVPILFCASPQLLWISGQ